MKIKFKFLSCDDPYISEKSGGTYYSFNALLDPAIAGKQPVLVDCETDKKNFDQLKGSKAAEDFEGQFTISASFGRKRPELRLVSF